MYKYSSAGRMREYRQRKREEKERKEFHEFLMNTSFSSRVTDEKKFKSTLLTCKPEEM